MELPMINIARSHHKVLAEAFPNRSKQWINSVLRYRGMTDEAKRARALAFELLKKEAAKEIEYMSYEK